VTIDLTGIAAGTSVKLYFDLLGLGNKGSRIVVDNVQLLNGTNTAPSAVADTVTATTGVPLQIDVVANDTDAEGDHLTPSLVSTALNGTVVLNGDGTFTYTANAGFTGTDSFTYRVSDGSEVSNEATVTITVVAPVNHVPVAVNDTATLAEDSSVDINVRANDTDADNDALTASVVTGPAHGTLTVNADGSFHYVPTANYFGTDTFTYTVNDGHVDSNVATVSITVTPVNDAPVAANDTVSTAFDTAVRIDLLANDTDVENSVLTAVVVTGPQHGTLTTNADGSLNYVPDAGYSGPDEFTYRASDGDLQSDLATVSIAVAAPGNRAPVAVADTATIEEDSSVDINVRANDTDADNDTLTATVVTGPAHGTITVNADGSFHYAPTANYSGPDSFTYKVSDGQLDSNVATVSITVTPVNDAPVAADDLTSTSQGTPVTINVKANDSDIENDGLTVQIVGDPAHGQVTVNGDGTVTYTPVGTYSGTDSFTYRVSDGQAQSNLATVTINVSGATNTAPVAYDDSVSATEDTPLDINVLTNDTDAEGNALSATVVAGPSHGVLTVNPDGSFHYTPDANYHGPDEFTYRASDGQLESGIATVSITVASVNDVPVAQDDTARIIPNQAGTIDVLANDSDADVEDTLTPVLVDGPAHGTLVLNGDGSFTYTPDADYVGTDSFTYRASDGTAQSSIATVNILVATNLPPTATSSTVTGTEDTPYVFTWSDFQIADTDSTTLGVVIDSSPSSGCLEFFNGTEWTGVPICIPISKADIDAGHLRFIPGENASGYPGYANPDEAYGNLENHYAQFSYKPWDGEAEGNGATMTIDITPKVDAPVLIVTAPESWELNSREWNTYWSGVYDDDPGAVVLQQNWLDDWSLITTGDVVSGGLNAFVGWREGDDIPDADGVTHSANRPEGGSGSWIELSDTAGNTPQTLGVSRTMKTAAGATYTLAFAYAAHPGYSADYTGIAVYVDGVRIGGHAADATGGTSLDWEGLVFNFVGTGTAQTIRIVSEATEHAPEGRGAMLGQMWLNEKLPPNTTYADDSVYLTPTHACLFDEDGSESLTVEVTGVPVGATLHDQYGNSFTVTQADTSIDVTEWDYANLWVMPPAGFVGSFDLTFTATAKEAVTNETASSSHTSTVTVLPTNVPPVATGSALTIAEDTQHVFQWSDFNISDADDATAYMWLESWSYYGCLEFYNGTEWVDAPRWMPISKQEIDAGYLRFSPTHNESGYPGYANPDEAAGNLENHYFELSYGAWDGQADSEVVTLTINVTPVVDTPTLGLSPPDQWYRNKGEVAGSWWSIDDNDSDRQIWTQKWLTEWQLVTSGDTNVGGTNAFITWGDGDEMPDANGALQTISMVPNGAPSAVELSDAAGTSPQTLGISRTIKTVVGATYCVEFDYAGHVGYGADYTGIAVYVDGVRIGGHAADGGATDLNWEKLVFVFTGNGERQTIRIVTEANQHTADGVGALIGRIAVNETLLPNTAYQGDTIYLQPIRTDVADKDGSESLTVVVSGLPVGLTLIDGDGNTFTATAEQTELDISDWWYTNLRVQPPEGYTGTFTLTFTSTATEAVTEDSSSVSMTMDVTVVPVNVPPVAVDSTVTGLEDTPYVFQWSDFNLSDSDGPTPYLWLDYGPTRGWLEFYNGVEWIDAPHYLPISKEDIDAGYLRFIAEENESGYPGYDSPDEDYGNLKNHYAAFTYGAYDNTEPSAVAVMTVDVMPVLDTAVLAITPTQEDYLPYSSDYTSWYGMPMDEGKDVLNAHWLAGWSLITTGDANTGGVNAFVGWNDGDEIPDASGVTHAASMPANGQTHWLELSDAAGTNEQTLGVSVTGRTVAGATYYISLDYAAHPGYSADYTGVAVYVDGVRIGGHATDATGTTELNWENLEFSFTGTGEDQTIEIVSEATAFAPEGCGAMIAGVTGVEVLPRNTDFEGEYIRLDVISANLGDLDGSETGTLRVSGLPVGSTLTDGFENSYTTTAEDTFVDISEWRWYWGPLYVKGPDGYTGTFELTVTGTASELGTGESRTLTQSMNVTVVPVNVPPTAVASSITTAEDTPYVFTWADFNLSDPDTSNIYLWIENPTYSDCLQYYNGTEWVNAPWWTPISKSEIDAGYLKFVPRENESGHPGYGNPDEAFGNGENHYYQVAFGAWDGTADSDTVTMTIDVTPVTDDLELGIYGTGCGTLVDVFLTHWEDIANPDTGATIISQATLDGWTLVTSGDANSGGTNAFEFWADGDTMTNSLGDPITVTMPTDWASSWLHLNDAAGTATQTLGIERTVSTIAGDVYMLGFDYAAALDVGGDLSRVAVYVDGVKLDCYSYSSCETALNWSTAWFQFTGTGSPQTIRIVTDANVFTADGKGALIGDILLQRQTPNVGYQNAAIGLQEIWTRLGDTDGSESLSIVVSAIPVGATLSDGTQSFTATTGNTSVDIAGWSTSYLSLTPPEDFTGTIDLLVTATAAEWGTSDTVTRTATMRVTVLEGEPIDPLVLDLNGDGIQTQSLSESAGQFDLLNSGIAINSGWISAQDGFLAVDTNANGKVDSIAELFGDRTHDGFSMLSGLDSNEDGVVDDKDERFSELLVWQDANGNHVTDAGELQSLAERGIASLSLNTKSGTQAQNGNLIKDTSTAQTTDGKSITVADVFLQVDAADAAAALRRPDLRSTSIRVRSELPALRRPRIEVPEAATIDWRVPATACTMPEEETIDRSYSHWVPQFLGLDAEDKRDLEKLTGLKVRHPRIDLPKHTY
jgi:VCBS repeat-containing protein